MTNQTIDGVPRAVIAAFAKVADSYSEAEDDSYEPWQDAMMHAELRLTLGQFRALRALLDAPAVERKAVLAVKRYDRDSVSGHSDVEIALSEHKIMHHDHGPNLAEALARLAGRVARFHKLQAPSLAAQPQGVPIYQVEYLGEGGGGWNDISPQEFSVWQGKPDFRTRIVYAEQPAPVAFDIELAAQKLASCMDYPWDHMPEQGRASMREHAKAIVNAAVPVAVVLPSRDRLRDLIAQAIGSDTYDCVRVWSAWGVGTMSEDDFVPVVEQEARLYEIADACLEEVASVNGAKP